MAAATTIDDVARYVKPHPDSGVYRYYRRVPLETARLDRRTFVKQSLKTKSLAVALERAVPVHDACAALWSSLIAGAEAETSFQRYDAAVKLAQSLGFAYRPAADIAAGPIDELVARLDAAAAHPGTTIIAEALLGTVPEPEPRLSELWGLYEQHNADGLAGMSPHQLKKHKTSRERAITYLVARIGDKRLRDITRADALSFKDWWTKKIATEGLTAYAGNRSINDLRGMLRVVDTALQTDFWAVWSKVRIVETNANALSKRPPFPVKWVEQRILAPGALDGLNIEARCIVYVLCETGMRPTEICNLIPGTGIMLEHEVPHVAVENRPDRRQKSKYSTRRIPLVGVALWAMKQCPEGFPRYRDNADALSALANDYLTARQLRPTPEHTLYSLRHTFSDRLEDGGASDRMHADLMGHEFGRPAYGDGPELKRRQELLQRIAFKVGWAV